MALDETKIIEQLIRLDERLKANEKNNEQWLRDYQRIHERLGGNAANSYYGMEAVQQEHGRVLEGLVKDLIEIRKGITGNGGKESFAIKFVKYDNSIHEILEWIRSQEEKEEMKNKQKDNLASKLWDLFLVLVKLAEGLLLAWVAWKFFST